MWHLGTSVHPSRVRRRGFFYLHVSRVLRFAGEVTLHLILQHRHGRHPGEEAAYEDGPEGCVDPGIRVETGGEKVDYR